MRTSLLYAWAILKEFRYTLLLLAAAVAIGTLAFRLTPDASGHRPTMLVSIYAGWMALLAQPIYSPPPTWPLTILCAVYPVFGFVLVGEGVVRLALLMVSRRQGQKEWMRVMASTYRDHVMLCGLGHLGYRVLEQFVAAGVPVVVLEKRRNAKQYPHARELGVPILIRDMKEDQALIDAGFKHARAIVICTNDDMANLEVALDARRLNPDIRVIMRLYDQQIAEKIRDAMSVDAAFSSSTLAAPAIAALTLEVRSLSSYVIAGVPHVAADVQIAAGCDLAGKRIDEIEAAYAARELTRTVDAKTLESPPAPATVLREGDRLVVHTRAERLPAFSAAAARKSNN